MEYYKELARRMRRRYLDSLGNVVLQKPEDVYSDCNQAATAIYDLLGMVKLDADAIDYLKKRLAEFKDRAAAAEADRDRLRDAIEKQSEYEQFMEKWKSAAEIAGECDGCSVPATTAEMIRDLNDAPKLRAENEKLRAELENYRKGHCSEGGCAAERDRDLVIAENERLRAELERVKVERDAYQAYFKDLSSKPDCNTCEKRNCEYRPKPGATVRANCPLYSGPEKDD